MHVSLICRTSWLGDVDGVSFVFALHTKFILFSVLLPLYFLVSFLSVLRRIGEVIEAEVAIIKLQKGKKGEYQSGIR